MKHISIRFRLMILMILLTTLPVVTVTWIATTNMRESVEKEIFSANQSRMLWADQYLSELIAQVDVLFYTLQINQSLMTAMQELESPDVGVQFRRQNVIWQTLASVFYANSRKFDEVALYVEQLKRAYYVNFSSNGSLPLSEMESEAWERIRFVPINMYFKQTSSGTYAFHSINRFEDRKLLGGISVRINTKVWEEVGSILRSEADSSVFLLNDEDELLSGSTAQDASGELSDFLKTLHLSDSELFSERGKNYLYFAKKVVDGQLTVIKAIPMSSINQSANATIRAGLYTGAAFAVASLLLSILVSLRISRPIVSLARTMRQTQIHNFEMKAVQSRDEIGLLEAGYNSMMRRIKELIEVEYQHQIEVKNAQLMALQAQINPHFMYNTLHLIGGMALGKNAPEIYNIIRVFGDLIRYSIGSDEDKVSLEEELKHTRNYLFIQEHRFMGRCTILLTVDEMTLDSMLPKFTLQPIVENAFEHGLQRKEGAWRLEIRIRQVRGRVIVMIRDEGIGMKRDVLLRLRRELSEELLKKTFAAQRKEGQRKGIGLHNVDARLKLSFGPAYGIRLFSAPGAGTLVVATIPLEGGKTLEYV
ncbi:sensor histidine kinase [Paenibacillus sp. GCM10012307]|uniref:Sensor histidine kinase n=1 Tax=Paenibacillus roseus TaxID=2798579 RepID=A0A934J3L8_9BACL|nr:sensor histidine kinase [Paenibacillus roseus]MBJ6359758.1 sensor histidine kinase [Paenibacillus roseus]